MKKKLAILISLMMVLCFTFAACGGGGGSEDLSDSKYVGTWVATHMTMSAESEDVSDGSVYLYINGDGTGTMESQEDGGESEVSEFTWEPTDGGFKTSGDVKMKFTDDGDGIKAKILGAELHFVREGSEPAEEESSADTKDYAKYGYSGSDPVEAAVYKYLIDTVAAEYDPPEDAYSIPTVHVINVEVDDEDGEAEVIGDFWIENYVVEGDTLKCVSGGAHPGKMELKKDGEEYAVTEFEPVLDGADYESSAKDIFEEHYDEFAKVSSDSEAREKLRAETVATYVKASGLEVTKYQDEGWDAVELAL